MLTAGSYPTAHSEPGLSVDYLYWLDVINCHVVTDRPRQNPIQRRGGWRTEAPFCSEASVAGLLSLPWCDRLLPQLSAIAHRPYRCSISPRQLCSISFMNTHTVGGWNGSPLYIHILKSRASSISEYDFIWK